jgi:hypothetical protein
VSHAVPRGQGRLLARLLDELDSRRGERSREPERWHAVGDVLPLEIELDILEMRSTLLAGEDPHILHRRIVPDCPPHAPSDLLSWWGSRWTPP